MWEQLPGTPIIPMVFLGSFDLYPVGSWINTPGKVVVRYLTPILPNEASSRDEMLRLVRLTNDSLNLIYKYIDLALFIKYLTLITWIFLFYFIHLCVFIFICCIYIFINCVHCLQVRRRTLESLRDCPVNICSPITWSERLQSLVLVGVSLYVNLLMKRFVEYVGFDCLRLNLGQFVVGLIGLTLGITAALYIYYVYVVTSGNNNNNNNSNNNSNNKSKQVSL